MKMQRFFIAMLLLAFLFTSFILNAYDETGCEPGIVCDDCSCCCLYRPLHHFYVEPEIYHVRRLREGGTKQSGWLFGAKIGYDHLKRYKFYWGGHLLYAAGRLSGHSGNDDKLKSNFTDFEVEGRFGYTFEQKNCWRLSFTPYIGYGYAVEKNNFIHPSPLHIHFKLYYSYFPIGFYFQMSPTDCFDIGLNFKAKYLFETKNKATNDPNHESSTMLVQNEMHYRVELPLTYHYNECFFASLIPFYEFRHYGFHSNFPFDFLDTKLRIYGLGVRLTYSF